MTGGVLLCFFVSYYLLLVLIAFLTSRKSTGNDTFFAANHSSRWYMVAFGMIGTSISGVTFISLPGTVKEGAFSYFQFTMGNAVGYMLIVFVLMPLFYQLKLTSIYTYLEKRFGYWSYKTGAFFFLVSRLIGSSFRLFLVAIVLQHFVFDAWGLPFWFTVAVTLLLIWSYTFRSGLKTIIWTDAVQTIFLVASVLLSIVFIAQSMQLGLKGLLDTVRHSSYARFFFFENFMGDKKHFLKYFFGGIAVAVAMTGLDQDLMQKNLSCRNLHDAKKNMLSFTGIFILMNLFFLGVGALLFIYAQSNNIVLPERPDYIYPEIAFHYLGSAAAVVFLLGLTSATFATTDSALTALTTSFCVDFLGMDKKMASGGDARRMIRIRKQVHIGFSLLFLGVVVAFKYLIRESVVLAIFNVASYTYGPLLGLFMYGIVSKRPIRDSWAPVICLMSPLICWMLEANAGTLFNGYSFGFEMLIVNGLVTFAGVHLVSKKPARL